MHLDVWQNKAERARLKQSQLETFQFDPSDPNLEGPVLYDQILPNLQALSGKAKKTALPPRTQPDFGTLPAARMFRYYFLLESILEIELCVAKVGLTTREVIELDESIGKGIPYFINGHENYGVGEDSSSAAARADLLSILNSGKAAFDIGLTETGKRVAESQRGLQSTSLKILNQLYNK